LFDENAPRYRYTAVASNRIGSAADTLEWYAQRGETSENRIKELKLGFGMERMPCGQFQANAVFFRLSVLAYNLCQGLMKRFPALHPSGACASNFAPGEIVKRSALKKEWRQHQVQTLRWRLYQTAGKLVGRCSRSVTMSSNCSSTFGPSVGYWQMKGKPSPVIQINLSYSRFRRLAWVGLSKIQADGHFTRKKWVTTADSLSSAHRPHTAGAKKCPEWVRGKLLKITVADFWFASPR